jgi:hypothetical protein
MDIRDLIKTADVYGKEIENQQGKIDEGLMDWFRKQLGLSAEDAGAAVSALEKEGVKGDVNPDPLKLANPKGTSNTKSGGDQGFENYSDAAASNPKQGDKITIQGIEAETNIDSDGNPYFTHPGTQIPFDQPLDQDGGVSQGIDQIEDPANTKGQMGRNTPPPKTSAGTGDVPPAEKAKAGGDSVANKLPTDQNLMKAYNDGGKKPMQAIKDLQTALSRLGHDPNGIDGKYGNGTYAAVQAFQKANGLSVDGQAGPNTLKAIQDALNKGAGNADQQADAQDQSDQTAADNQAAADDAQNQGDANYADDAQATATPNLKQKIDRFNELLKKAQESDEAGVPNADRDAQERGVMVASTDFRHLIALVEGVLNEALTAEEEKELQALYQELKGSVGLEPDLDQAIEDALNNYLKVKGDPASPQTGAELDNDAVDSGGEVQDTTGTDGSDTEGEPPAVTLDSLAGQIKQGIKFDQFAKIVKDAEALEPEDAEKDANLLKKLGRKAQQLISTAEYRSRYVIANGAQNLQIDGLYRPDGSSFISMKNGEPVSGKGADTKQAMQVAQMGLLPQQKVDAFAKLAPKNPIFQQIIDAHNKATGATPAQQDDAQATDPNAQGGEEQVMSQDVTPSVEKRINSKGDRDNFNISSARSLPYVDTIEDGKRTRTYGDKAALEKMFPGKKIGGIKAPAQPKKEPTKAPAPQATGTVQMASKEHDMTKQINEASMNISMNGADAKEVADLVAILKNAGMDSSRIDMPMAHMHSPEPEGPMPCPTCGGDHGDSPCGMGEQTVDEGEWDNSPEETYADHHTMTKDLSGGINRQKDRKAIRVKDPAIESIKSDLQKALEEAYKNKKSKKKKY